MPRPSSPAAFRIAGPPLVRACAIEPFPMPPWPEVAQQAGIDGAAAGLRWLRHAWSATGVAAAISHASPDLARAVEHEITLEPAVTDRRKLRRQILAVQRYLVRMTGRPTPFGLFAGVVPAADGPSPAARWGSAHHAVAQPSAGWLAEVIDTLERVPALFARVLVVRNSAATVRAGYLVVQHQQHGAAVTTTAVEVTIRMTPAVDLVVQHTAEPIRIGDLLDRLRAAFRGQPTAAIATMLHGLVAHRALITNLHAPSVEPDALHHLLQALGEAMAVQVPEVADTVWRLHEIAMLIEKHNAGAPEVQPELRKHLAAAMQVQAPAQTHPLALDLRLDARVVVPHQVLDDAARAAVIYARLSEAPFGTAAWREYHRRFYERYGIGTLVPVLDVVDTDSGIGFPAGYPGTLVDPPRPTLKSRDELLLSLIQTAILDGRNEVVLDDALLGRLDIGPRPARLPSHLELAVRLNAASGEALRQGHYTVEGVQISRNVGGLIGRFLPLLAPADAAAYLAAIADLPGSDAETMPVQVSFPPLDPATADVARAPKTLPTILTVAEHHRGDERTLTVADIAVGCDGRRLFLAVPRLGRRIEVSAMHALNPKVHTPPLVRFMIELTRAQCAQITGVRWGAAGSLPYRPRLRYGRFILAPAAWQVTAADLPDATATRADWAAGLAEWRQRRRVPQHVRLNVDDMRLLLNLDQPGHQELLRRHVSRHDRAILTEVVDPAGAGWCDGRAHEIVVPLRAVTPPPWPTLPAPSPARLGERDDGERLGTSTLVYAQLFGDLRRQDIVLAEHLPNLLATFDQEPEWWFLRYRDADRFDPHLRLRIRVADLDAVAGTVLRISAWADRLHRDRLIREVRYPTSYAEPGRWGGGPVLLAAERVFAADSRAVLTQLRQPRQPDRQALIAAHTVAICSAFLGSTAAAMDWIIEYVAAAPSRTPIPRPIYAEAVRIADPDDDWAALRARPGGAEIAAAWQTRNDAIVQWRAGLGTPGPDVEGVRLHDALRHCLHGHYIRARGIDFDDEPACLHLARSAALAWTARRREPRS